MAQMQLRTRETLIRLADAMLAVGDRISQMIAFVSGSLFLLLSFYITIDALGRSFGGPYSAVTNDISVYTLAAAGTWGFAHALRKSAHVRVDLLLPMIPVRQRYLINIGNTALVGVFAAITSFYCWHLVHGSWLTGARSITPLQTPLVIPQSLMAAGLTALAIEAFVIATYGVTRFLLVERDTLIRDAGDPLTSIESGSI
jgi:TRAP-type C4-dicarboxylate transport system permease small subunit